MIKKSNFQKFKNKCKLQKIRRNDYTNYLFEKCNFITDFIKKIVKQEEVKNELLALFRDEKTRDINGVNKTWTKKVKTLSEAALRDQEKSIPQIRLNNLLHYNSSPKLCASKCN